MQQADLQECLRSSDALARTQRRSTLQHLPGSLQCSAGESSSQASSPGLRGMTHRGSPHLTEAAHEAEVKVELAGAWLVPYHSRGGRELQPSADHSRTTNPVASEHLDSDA